MTMREGLRVDVIGGAYKGATGTLARRCLTTLDGRPMLTETWWVRTERYQGRVAASDIRAQREDNANE
jgi:hypothetical protein